MFAVAVLPLSLDLQLKPIYEMRQRFERRTDRDLNVGNPDNRSEFLGRYRAGFTFRTGNVNGKIVYQLSNIPTWTVQRNFSQERSDLVDAYVVLPAGPGKLTVGRQRLAIGSQRLIGELNWNNITNAFDLVRYDQGALSVFAGTQGVMPLPSNNLRLAGVTYKSPAGITLAAVKGDRLFGVEKGRLTVSQEAVINSGGFTWDLQGVGQVGHQAGQRVEAWATFARVSHPVVKNLRAFVESNVASGGQSGNVVRTFDQLYPLAHDRLGLIDTTGWSNVQQAGVGLRYTPSPKLMLKIQAMDLALRDASDAWYGIGLRPNRRVGGVYQSPSGAFGREIGQEVDFDGMVQISSRDTITFGIGALWPGRFVTSFQPGQSTRQVWGYFSYLVRF